MEKKTCFFKLLFQFLIVFDSYQVNIFAVELEPIDIIRTERYCLYPFGAVIIDCSRLSIVVAEHKSLVRMGNSRIEAIHFSSQLLPAQHIRKILRQGMVFTIFPTQQAHRLVLFRMLHDRLWGSIGKQIKVHGNKKRHWTQNKQWL